MKHVPLVAIVLGALFVASLWLVRVPFMQETDEQAHADYAYTFFDVSGYFHVTDGIRRDRTTSEVRYLATHSRFYALRHDPAARVPAGYGTAAYFERLDRGAPRPSHRAPLPQRKVAYVMYSYPIGYYALAAIAMASAYAMTHGSLVATYFAARALGIGCLAITLVAAYVVFRSSKVTRSLSLVLVAALGFMPLTSWVSAYIQPDTLTVACAMVVLALLVRWRARPFEVRSTLALGAAIVATCFVKQHYALALGAACDAVMLGRAIATRPTTRRLAVAVAALVAAPLAAFVVATHVTPVGALRMPAEFAMANGHASPLLFTANDLRYAIDEGFGVFAGGAPFLTYWFYFGDLLTPYVSNAFASRCLYDAIALASIVVLALFAYRQAAVVRSLARIARRRPHASVALALSDPVLDVYVAWTLLLLAVYARSHGHMYLEGRYFLAMTVPAMLIGVRYVPRPWPRRARGALAGTIAALWLTASAVLAPLAYASMERRFYGAPAPNSMRAASAARTRSTPSETSWSGTLAKVVESCSQILFYLASTWNRGRLMRLSLE